MLGVLKADGAFDGDHASTDEHNLDASVEATSLAYLIYTSGATVGDDP
jgi:hypothetical protein